MIQQQAPHSVAVANCSNSSSVTLSWRKGENVVTKERTRTEQIEVATEACFRLIYRSHSRLQRAEGDNDALAEILRVSRANNGGRGVTGALVLYEYKDRFAQVLEGPEAEVRALFTTIEADPRHDNVEVNVAESVPVRLFSRWSMALVVEHHEPDVPLIATAGGLKEAAPWRVSLEQEQILTQLRDLTRGYGRSY